MRRRMLSLVLITALLAGCVFAFDLAGIGIGLALAIVLSLPVGRVTYLCVAIVGVSVLAGLLLPVQGQARAVIWRETCITNLARIAAALQQYADEHGRLPPAYVTDPSGRPMHSWRVLLLPYLGQKELYDKYNFNEPWDGPHNRRLAADAPSPYVCPSDAHNFSAQDASLPVAANYVAVVGPGAAWSEGDAGNAPEDIILVVEVPGRSGTSWMQPEDLPLEIAAKGVGADPQPRIGSCHSGGIAHVAFADGSVRRLTANLSPKAIRPLLTVHADKTIGVESLGLNRLNKVPPVPQTRRIAGMLVITLAGALLIVERRHHHRGKVKTIPQEPPEATSSSNPA